MTTTLVLHNHFRPKVILPSAITDYFTRDLTSPILCPQP